MKNTPRVSTEALVCCGAASAPGLPPQGERWQSPVCCHHSSPLTFLERHLLFLSSVSFLAGLHSLWLTELTFSLPPGNIQTCTNCPSRSDYSIVQFLFLRRLLKDLRAVIGAITSEILGWTSERKLTCWCNEGFLPWVVQKEHVRENRSQISNCEFSLRS